MSYEPKTIILPDGMDWDSILKEPYLKRFESLLPAFLRNCRWFGGKAKNISRTHVRAREFLPEKREQTLLLIVTVSYTDAQSDQYLLPVSFRFTDPAAADDISSRLVPARIRIGSRSGIIYDATRDPSFRDDCFRFISRKSLTSVNRKYIRGIPGKHLGDWIESNSSIPESRLLMKDQSNTSFIYGNNYFLKIYRRMTDGINPEVEMIRFLTEVAGFPHIAPYAGLIEEQSPGSPPVTLALLQKYVEHTSDGWDHFLKAARERLSRQHYNLKNWRGEKYLEEVSLLGRRTAQLHQALASQPGVTEFSPEPYSPADRENHLQSSLSMLEETFRALEYREKDFTPELLTETRKLHDRKAGLTDRLGQIVNHPDPGLKIRIHGDYHLGQTLYTGDDFVIIDFEGEPARSIDERKQKRSPLIDVAGMIRSFHYAAYGAIFLDRKPTAEEITRLSPRAEEWYLIMSGTFLTSYRETISRGKADLLPANPKDLKQLLEYFLLEKAIYELNYELNNRPEWVIIPLRAIKIEY